VRFEVITAVCYEVQFGTSSILHDGVAGSSETLVNVYQTTRGHIPEDCIPDRGLGIMRSNLFMSREFNTSGNPQDMGLGENDSSQQTAINDHIQFRV
jgi:hypothetical protein